MNYQRFNESLKDLINYWFWKKEDTYAILCHLVKFYDCMPISCDDHLKKVIKIKNHNYNQNIQSFYLVSLMLILINTRKAIKTSFLNIFTQ